MNVKNVRVALNGHHSHDAIGGNQSCPQNVVQLLSRLIFNYFTPNNECQELV